MRPEFDDLRERLLKAGVKPGLVARYAAELSDHFDDLLAHETAETALRRMGPPETLAAAMLAQPGVRSWTARAPWATLTLGPLLALVLGCVLPSLLLFGIVRAFAADLDYGRAATAGTWPQLALQIIYAFNERLLPILIGWAAVVVALRQRAGLGWLLPGVVLTAFAGAGLYLWVDWRAGHPANLSFMLGFELKPMFTTVWGRSLDTGVLNLVAILAPYAAYALRKPSRA